MNAKRFHQQTIRGLIQITVNRTLEDLVQRRLIDTEDNQEPVVNWNNIRSLDREIDFLSERGFNTRRERQTIENLITEIRLRAPFLQATLLDPKALKTPYQQELEFTLIIFAEIIELHLKISLDFISL